IMAMDEAQRITIFNRAAEQIFGWSRGEVVGQSLDILLPERLREIHRSHVRRFAAGETATRKVGVPGRPIYGLRKDGAEFPAETAISRLQMDSETTFTVVLRDITESLRLERALREAHRFLENVLDSTVEHSLMALDLERRIVVWTEGAHRQYGYSAREIVGSPVDVLHAPNDIASGVVASLYARALEQGSATAVLRRRRKDGSEFLG